MRTATAGSTITSILFFAFPLRLTTNMERVSKIGQPLAMKCSSSEKTMKSCKWTTPNKTTFDSKSPIEGVTAILNDDHNCHIQINSLSKEQLGKWSCRVELEGENQYQEAILTATESLPVTEGKNFLNMLWGPSRNDVTHFFFFFETFDPPPCHPFF